MDGENIIDVEIEEKLYSVEEVSEITGITPAKITFYSKKLGDILRINEVGTYQVFDNIDISNITKVKSLDEKGMSISEIREHLINNKHEILLENKVERTEKDFLDFFVGIVHKQNQKIDEVIKSNDEVVQSNKNLVDIIAKLIDNQSLLPQPNNEDIVKEISDNIALKLSDVKIDIEKNLKENIEEHNREMKDDVKYIRERLHAAYVTEQEIREMSFKNKKSMFDKLFNWKK